MPGRCGANPLHFRQHRSKARQKHGRRRGLDAPRPRQQAVEQRGSGRASPEIEPIPLSVGAHPVTDAPVDHRHLLPQAFFARATERLHGEPPNGPAAGDQALNPGLFVDGPDFRDAAVLLPLVEHESGLTALLTLRTPHLAVHAGQIAFPGGKVEPSDKGPAAAALREACEEIGLDPAAVRVVGYLDRYLTGTGYRITPVVGRVAPDPMLALNPEEVQEAFEVPLAFLMDPKNHHRASRIFMGRERHFYEMPFEGRYIWGITAGIIRGLYERMFDS